MKHCQRIASEKRKAYADWDYWGKPVPNFGDHAGRLLIVGLAPGAHGANRTGRMFTGDRSGEWLYRAMHRAGFGNQEAATDANDGLNLIDAAVTNVCHCAPPDNRPSNDEIENCRFWLDDLLELGKHKVFIAFGQVGWRGLWIALREKGWSSGAIPKFSHGAEIKIEDGKRIIGSYHPSQQNTFTGRLTEEMLEKIFFRAKDLLDAI